jgi:hypothetical protein
MKALLATLIFTALLLAGFATASHLSNDYWLHCEGIPTVCSEALSPTTTITDTQTVTVTPPPPPAVTPTFGFSNGWYRGTAADLNKQVSIGAVWNRVDFAWSAIETSPNVYSWGPYDQFVERANAAGVKIVANLAYTPSFYRVTPGYDDKYEPTEAGISAYANFMAATVARYAPLGVMHYEIWNEQNSFQFWKPKPNPGKYTRLLSMAYQAAKSVNPNVVIITGGTSPAGGYMDSAYQVGQNNVNAIRYLEAMYASGAGGKFDALGHHPYWCSGCPPDLNHYQNAWLQMYGTTPSLRSVMVANGDGGKRIYATELGQRSRPSPATEENQASSISRAVTLWKTYSWSGLFAVYIERESMNGGDDSFWSYGLLRNTGAEKPAWLAYASAISG